MKVFTEEQVKELLEIQRGNCYVALLSATRDEKLSSLATSAPLPAGEQFDKMYGIDVLSLLDEDLEDKELQRNFDFFKKQREAAKTSYNALVPKLNSMIDMIVNLKELIVSLSMQGLSTENAVKRLAKLDDRFTKLSERADAYKSEMDKQTDLIKKYEDWNERKLFMHWKYLTMLKITNVPWLDWKSTYNDTIL